MGTQLGVLLSNQPTWFPLGRGFVLRFGRITGTQFCPRISNRSQTMKNALLASIAAIGLMGCSFKTAEIQGPFIPFA